MLFFVLLAGQVKSAKPDFLEFCSPNHRLVLILDMIVNYESDRIVGSGSQPVPDGQVRSGYSLAHDNQVLNEKHVNGFSRGVQSGSALCV